MGEIAVFVVDGLDASAVDRQQLPAEQVELPAQQHELAEYRAEGRAVVAAEIGDRFEIRLQVPQQPDHFQIAMRLRLQPPARPHPVQITVNVELQQIAGRVPRAPVASGTTRANPSAARSSPSTKASMNR